ncbi:mobile mystery protein B [Croceimicrobium sp.]|uniref:mobile mystery protein B n=1 Tax=Croceimicrobium sp. TaxID=2828340 RepID=UPI003BA9DE3A
MGLNLSYSPGQTPINEEEKDGLKINTIVNQAELDEFEQLNIEKAIAWTIQQKFTVEKILSAIFIKSLHKRMFGDVWKWAGNFRNSEKNLGVPWTQINIELHKLLDDTKFWITEKSYPPEEIAIRFKHRLVSIHCFPNGNGRHSRLMADLILETLTSQNAFNWGQNQMSQANNTRKKYIAALKIADGGNIDDLLRFAKEKL